MAGLQTTFIGLTPFPLYDAIIDAGGGGNFTSIGEAFASGAICVYVRNGVYNETSITLPEGFCLVGESRSGVVINFPSTAGFVCEPTLLQETTGTISITVDTTTVTGVGTTFTNLSSGDFINIAGVFCEIDTVTNDTTLAITVQYEGSTVAGINFVAQTMFIGGSFYNFTIAQANGRAIDFRRILSLNIDNLNIENSTGNRIRQCSNVSIKRVDILNTSGSGLSIVDSFSVIVNGCSSNNASGDGFAVTTIEFGTNILSDCICSENGSDGVSLAGEGDIILSNFETSFNASIGINSSSGPCCVTISNSLCTNNAVHGFACSANGTSLTLMGNRFLSNGNSGVSLAGNGVLSSACIIGNTILGNTLFGIFFGGTITSFGPLIVSENIVTGSGTNYVWVPLARVALISDEVLQFCFNSAIPTAVANVDGLQQVPFEGNITSVFMSVGQRGSASSTVADLNVHTPTIVQGSEVFNAIGTSIYPTATKPTITGDAGTATQNGFIYAANPDTVELSENQFLSMDFDSIATGVTDAKVIVNLKRIPQ